MTSCKNCVHHPICEWCNENTEKFHFPKNGKVCEMYSNAVNDIEDAVANAGAEARRMMNEADEISLYNFYRGRWSACKDILEYVSVYDTLGREMVQVKEGSNGE